MRITLKQNRGEIAYQVISTQGQNCEWREVRESDLKAALGAHYPNLEQAMGRLLETGYIHTRSEVFKVLKQDD